MTRFLVTGAAGFIGSHLTEMLVEEGAEVRALVRYNSSSSWGWLDSLPAKIKDEIEVVSGDIRDPFLARRAVAGTDVVLHLAALIGIPYSYVAPADYVATNINGTLNLLEAARDLGVERFVHTSTSEVYGSARFVPISEDHPLQPQSPYSASKIGADQLALSFHLSFGTPVVVVRPFNTYGPRQSARAVIPTIISQLMQGENVKLGSLDPTRDFNFVKDTVRGFIAAASTPGIDGRTVNLGSNFEISIGDTLAVIAALTGRDVSVETEIQRLRPEKSEVDRLWADNTLARELLGWEPKYGGLEGFRRGIAETIDWFSDPANQARYRHDRYAV